MPPDYALVDVLELTTPEQFAALGDAFRQHLLGLLLERAATTGQLARALGRPLTTVAHHLRVLSAAGLIRVVGPPQPRKTSKRYYGRTAYTYLGVSSPSAGAEHAGRRLPGRAVAALVVGPSDAPFPTTILSSARLPVAQAHAFAERVRQLAQEFQNTQVPGEQLYGLLATIYRTDHLDGPADPREDPPGAAGLDRGDPAEPRQERCNRH